MIKFINIKTINDEEYSVNINRIVLVTYRSDGVTEIHVDGKFRLDTKDELIKSVLTGLVI